MEAIQGKLFDDSAFIKGVTFSQCFELSKLMYSKTIGADIVTVPVSLDDMMTQNEKRYWNKMWVTDETGQIPIGVAPTGKIFYIDFAN
jgi:hypothetical protein